jgi:hypothetical protein
MVCELWFQTMDGEELTIIANISKKNVETLEQQLYGQYASGIIADYYVQSRKKGVSDSISEVMQEFILQPAPPLSLR